VDTYCCYSQLEENEKEGIDFERLVCFRDGATVAIIAPHAGGIEQRTGDITQDIAGTTFSFYCFRGLKKNGNRVLHITSHNFDEPKCEELVANHRWVVAIHGCAERGEHVILGGLDTTLINDFALSLSRRGIVAETGGHRYTGISPTNICNRGINGEGVQFELSLPFRNGKKAPAFVEAVRAVLLGRQNGA
jgi:phage replication-related protein YjqB (UPF0714/DUF867 family)